MADTARTEIMEKGKLNVVKELSFNNDL